MNSYSYADVIKIRFTEEDIDMALAEILPDDRVKAAVTIQETVLGPLSIEALGMIASDIKGGRMTTLYGNLAIVRPKTHDELREQALYDLRYTSRYADVRDERAAESGVSPRQD